MFWLGLRLDPKWLIKMAIEWEKWGDHYEATDDSGWRMWRIALKHLDRVRPDERSEEWRVARDRIQSKFDESPKLVIRAPSRRRPPPNTPSV